IAIEFHIFEPYANRLNAVRLAAEQHAQQLAVVAGAREVRVIERALPAPLAERAAASFLWPLGKEPVFRISDNDYDNPKDRRERQPNVLRSKFLDDERLVRPTEDAPKDLARERALRLGGAPKPVLKADAEKPTLPALVAAKPKQVTVRTASAKAKGVPAAATKPAAAARPAAKKPAKKPAKKK
ncbi:MAG: hypothetical protein IT382_13415, partial [Deltaproteobacteria bacterium]|nr:hypothetical protein [Deltaproteobacteria bacterium]